ncbi:MAG: hypothetical protein KKC55_14850 [Gammaproteobacteria bacterium]|uniref:Uncharacterized protein n=1 Tax=viral metagenome TaxID=1070528 RepID=A0A6M3X4T5_9ZZZZ|nr:hypothetical protein [Gammaproteobacteria bacterium]
MIKVTITIEEVKERDAMAIHHNFKSDKDTTLPEMLIANAVLAASIRITEDMQGDMKALEPEACRD